MLQELTTETGASVWAIASLLFFAVFYGVVTVRTLRARREDLDAQARLALEGDEPRA